MAGIPEKKRKLVWYNQRKRRPLREYMRPTRGKRKAHTPHNKWLTEGLDTTPVQCEWSTRKSEARKCTRVLERYRSTSMQRRRRTVHSRETEAENVEGPRKSYTTDVNTMAKEVLGPLEGSRSRSRKRAPNEVVHDGHRYHHGRARST